MHHCCMLYSTSESSHDMHGFVGFGEGEGEGRGEGRGDEPGLGDDGGRGDGDGTGSWKLGTRKLYVLVVGVHVKPLPTARAVTVIVWPIRCARSAHDMVSPSPPGTITFGDVV